MNRTRNDLTVVFQNPRRVRRVTFNGVAYTTTWNQLLVTLPSGAQLVYDRQNMIDVQATTNHAAAAA